MFLSSCVAITPGSLRMRGLKISRFPKPPRAHIDHTPGHGHHKALGKRERRA